MNCHFVSESITKPWETHNRYLYYYDFKTKNIRKKSYSKLFTQEDLLTKEQEDWISKNIERPIGIFKKRYLNNEAENEIESWKIYRALILYFLGQSERFRLLLKDHTTEISSLFTKNDSDLDKIVSLAMNKFKIMTMDVKRWSYFIFSKNGFFIVPARDGVCLSTFTYLFALPLTPFTCHPKQ
jgi:hypothetical protein